jgi:hypothetical protein
MVGINNEPPAYAALALRVLMMVLRRQRVALIACSLTMTAHATIDAGARCRLSWPPNLIKNRVVVVSEIIWVLVQRHLIGPFLLEKEAGA